MAKKPTATKPEGKTYEETITHRVNVASRSISALGKVARSKKFGSGVTAAHAKKIREHLERELEASLAALDAAAAGEAVSSGGGFEL